MSALDEVYSKNKLIPAIEKVNDEVLKQFKGFSLDDFFARPDNKWSAFDTLRHLITSVGAVTLALRLPRFVLTMLFGTVDGPSRQYAEIKTLYRKHLERGARATGRYAPRLIEIPATQLEAEALRIKTLRKWRKTSKAMVKTLYNWTDSTLDRTLLPHPILGKLSAREMLFFTLYHNLHHTKTVLRRIQERGER